MIYFIRMILSFFISFISIIVFVIVWDGGDVQGSGRGDSRESTRISVELKPIISWIGEPFVSEPIALSLISGLEPHMLKWNSGDTIIETPQNCIIEFNKSGFWVPEITIDGRIIPIHQYEIYIY